MAAYKGKAMRTTNYRLAVRVRPAEHSDLSSVLSIDAQDTTNNGADYVPDLYHEILKRPGTYAFVGEFARKMCGFAVFDIVEEGAGAVLSAFRINKQLHTLRLADTFQSLIKEAIKRSIPTLKWLRWVARSSDEITKVAELTKDSFRVLETRKMTSIDLTKSKCLDLLRVLHERFQKPEITARQVSFEELRDIISSEETSSMLFPKGHIYTSYNYFPLRAPNKDIKPLYLENTTYVLGDSRRTGPNGLGVSSLCPGWKYQVVCRLHYHGQDDEHLLVAFLGQALTDIAAHIGTDSVLRLELSYPDGMAPKQTTAEIAKHATTDSCSYKIQLNEDLLFSG